MSAPGGLASLPPAGWCAVTLGQLLTGLEAGKSFECEPRPATSGEWGVIKVSAMSWGQFDERENKAIPASTAFDHSKEIHELDLLISRSNTVELVGASVLVGRCRPGLLLSDKSVRLKYAAALSAAWLQSALASPDVRSQMSLLATGTSDSMRNISQEKLKRVELWLPPAGEQMRIVSALDELLSDLDASVSALERALRKLKLYRASVLKAAVEGQLTAEWRAQHPNVEPASALLERVTSERRRGWEQERHRELACNGQKSATSSKGYVAPVPPDTADVPQQVPEGWVVASMDALTRRITSGSRDWRRFYGGGSGTFVMAQNVRPGRFDLGIRQAVDPPKDDPSCARSRIELNDLLVTIVGANTGDVCRVPDSLDEHYVCQSVALMRPVMRETAPFLAHYFNSPGGGQMHYRRYIYGAGRPHLSFDQLRMTPVLLPPLAEQEAIVEAVEDQLSVIDHLEAQIAAKLASAKSLRQAILRHAFTGRLVPQDPNDEPASELLKRIAAERARSALATEGRARKSRVGRKRADAGSDEPRRQPEP